jgi:anaphase-promoting complex subunit 3
MTTNAFTQLLEETLSASTDNFLGDNADFFARLLFDNLGPSDSRERLARYYISQRMYLQTARLLQKPASEIEQYILGVALFYLEKYDDAMVALVGGSTNRSLADFLRESQQKAVETVFLDQLSPRSGSETPQFETLGPGRFSLSPEIKRKERKEPSGRFGNSVRALGNTDLNPISLGGRPMEAKTPPRKKKADGGRRLRQKPPNFRLTDFPADCVANGVFGFYFLGLCFEKKGKLEEALMCFRNGYRIDPRMFHCYLKFVELVSKTEFQKMLREARAPDEVSLVERLSKDAGKRRKMRPKLISSTKLMSYLLQNASQSGLLRKRDALEAEISSPDLKKRGHRSTKRAKVGGERMPSDFLMGCHSTLSGVTPNANVCPADRILSGLVCKKENQKIGKKIGPKLDQIHLTEFKSGLGKAINGGQHNDGDCLNVSSLFLTSIRPDEPLKPAFDSASMALSQTDRPSAILQKENADISLDAELSHSPHRFEFEPEKPEKKVPPTSQPRKKAVKASQELHPANPLLIFLNTLKQIVVHFSFHEYPDVIEAASSYTAAADAHPTDQKCSFAVVLAARSCMNKMDYERATRLFELAQTQNPNTADGLDYYSSCLWYNRSISKLLELERKIAFDFPADPINLVIRGNSCSLVKKTEEAINCFRKALKRNPNDSYVLCLLGHEHMFLEDFTGATRCYRRALQADPLQFNAHWGLGNISKQRDESMEALVHFYHALAINPHCSLLYSYIGLTNLSLDWNKKAIENFERAEKQAGGDAMNSYYKAMAMFKVNDLEGAADVLAKLITTLKKEPKVYVLLGKIYHKMGKMEEAHDCFLHAIHLDPRDSQGKIRELSEWINAGIAN